MSLQSCDFYSATLQLGLDIIYIFYEINFEYLFLIWMSKEKDITRCISFKTI